MLVQPRRWGPFALWRVWKLNMDEELNLRLIVEYRDSDGQWQQYSQIETTAAAARLAGVVLAGLDRAIQEGRTTPAKIEEFSLGVLGIDAETWGRSYRMPHATGPEQIQ